MNGTPSFNSAVSVTVPYSATRLGTIDFPIVIYWDPHIQKYQPLQVTKVDRVRGYVTFVTKHFTDVAVVGLPGLASQLSGSTLFAAQFEAIDTEFTPQVDGFEIRNFDTELDNIAPSGACYGLTSFAEWYFANKALPFIGGVGLFAQYASKPDKARLSL